MDEKIFNAALAGLLHDVGKMEQRARVDPWKPPEGLDDTGQPVHAAWTERFIEHNVPADYRPAARHGAYHHQPQRSPAQDKTLSELVALADKLSAGERADEIPVGGDLPQQMISIFDRLTGLKKQPQPGTRYLPLQPLKLREEVIFPTEVLERESQRAAYEKLTEILRLAARQSITDRETYLENLLAAFQQATWCVPSAYYYSLPDISLYDHSRMTAALAVCLEGRTDIYALLEAVQASFAEKASPDQLELLEQPAALLLGGDLSGVQDFIYTLSSKGAARTLRGRSFYLQLLSEAILRFILETLGLPMSNVIYHGGGNFYLLVPLDAFERLAELRRMIAGKLLHCHGSELYLALDGVKVPFSGFHRGIFPTYWANMHTALRKAKLQRYIELGEEMQARIFTPHQFGGNPDHTCSVCGNDHVEVESLDSDAESGDRICTVCKSFGDQIGRKLPGARFIALGFGQAESVKVVDARSALASFGMQFQFIGSPEERVNLPGSQRRVIGALQDPVEDRWPVSQDLPAAHVLRYSVNLLPLVRDRKEAEEINSKLNRSVRQDPARPGEPKTFTHLEVQSGGFRRLGVLRMDGDNMGDVFQEGFDRPKEADSLATLARLSTLSFQISLFFDGWVKSICESYGGLVYAVYTGGDDLFLIAPWNLIPELASRIRKDFGRYTGEHPGLGLSGGMAFIHGKYPVYQAAEDAARAEKQAKDQPEKDSFSFLDAPWYWNEFDQLADRQELLVKIVAKPDKLPGGLGGPSDVLQRLRRLALQQAESAEKRGRPEWGPWVWQGSYHLMRLVEQYKQRPELAAAIEKVRKELVDQDFQGISRWGAAARWAQLRTRDEKVRTE